MVGLIASLFPSPELKYSDKERVLKNPHLCVILGRSVEELSLPASFQGDELGPRCSLNSMFSESSY